jgi:hypothetical protein
MSIYTTLKTTLLSNLDKVKEKFFLIQDKPLESLPEPYIPSPQDIASSASAAAAAVAKMPEKLREKAVRATHGPDANPSQLGDPVSLKAEQSDTVSTPRNEGAKTRKGRRDSKL